MQFVQDSLTFLIEAMALATLVFIAIDILNQARLFGGYQIPAGWQPEVIAIETNRPVNIKTDVVSTPVPEFIDPWLVEQETTTEVLNVKHKPIQLEQKPLLLLPPAKIDKPSEQLTNIDFDSLKLRTARKVAKLLGIAQKVNGKDQPLSWLKAQIKTKLLFQETVAYEEIEAVRVLIAS